MRGECRYCGFVAEWANESCWCGALSNPERKPTYPENMKKEEKIIQLLEMIVKQNEEIIKNQNIWRTLPTVPVPPNIDPHFGKDIPYVPYKGPDCADGFVNVVTTGTEITYIRDENSICGGAKVSADSLPDREWYG